MRWQLFIALAVAMVVGCAAKSPMMPEAGSPNVQTQQRTASADQHRLWGEFWLFIDSAHDKIDVVPKREARFHLNTVKFLESYCADCLKIMSIKKKGDGTVDVTVRITHPFTGHPEFTGFDVKGIIMFQGSHETKWGSIYMYPLADPFRVSWRLAGDPELLNPDGYTPRWNPDWDSGSSLPMFNYWPGKYAKGTPTANLNAFLNFYTDEDRHMFRVGKWVERTYNLSLPAGPLTVGYAVEACWEPPTVTPVTDPAKDFPYSANQPEPYYFHSVINQNKVIDYAPCCGSFDGCDYFWVDAKQWYGGDMTDYDASFSKPFWGGFGVSGIAKCSAYPKIPAPNPYSYYVGTAFVTNMFPDNGSYRAVSVIRRYTPYSLEAAAYDVWDFTIDIK